MNPATYLALVLVLAVAAQWLGWRLKLPALLFLLIIGFALGQWVTPDEMFGQSLLFGGVNLAVAIILFEGSLSLKLREVRDLGKPILRLCSVTVVIAWLLMALAAHLLGMDIRVALLLGALLVVTGPTVINPILRQVRPTRRVSALLRWEGIVVDPIGAILALLVYQAITSIGGNHIGHGLAVLGWTMVVSVLVAFPIGMLLTFMLRRLLIPDFLQGVIFVAVACGTVVGANLIQEESGLMAVTLLGIFLANQNLELDVVVEFKEHLQILLVGALFIMLAGRVNPDEIVRVLPVGLAFVAISVLLIRPLSVFIGLHGTETTRQERVLMAFMAPRGIVAASVTSVFALGFADTADSIAHQAEQLMATDPQRAADLSSFAQNLAGLSDQVDQLVPIVFLMIVCTVAIYGLGIGRLAERLGLASAKPRGVMFAGSPPWAVDAAKLLRSLDVPTLIVTRRSYDLYTARKAGLRTVAADFLSEYAVEEMDLSGINYMVACTPDDNTNSIAAVQYRRVLSRANVFQVRRADEGHPKDRTTGTVSTLKARTAFNPGLTHAEMERHWREGQRVRALPITEQFGWDQFTHYVSGAVILFIVRPGSTVVATEDMGNPKMGDIVVYLGRTPRIDELPRADRDAEDGKARRRAKVHTLRESMSTSSAEEQVRERANARADAERRPQPRGSAHRIPQERIEQDASGQRGTDEETRQRARTSSSHLDSEDIIAGTVIPGELDEPDGKSQNPR